MSYQKVLLIGHMGQDLEMITFDNGNSIGKFSLATNETWKDKETGEKKSHTTWHTCILQQKQAEALQQYLKKGTMIAVEGKISNRSYEKDGQKQYFTEIRVSGITFCGSSGGGASSENKASMQQQYGEDDGDDLPF